jgi:hypothetical protein
MLYRLVVLPWELLYSLVFLYVMSTTRGFIESPKFVIIKKLGFIIRPFVKARENQ